MADYHALHYFARTSSGTVAQNETSAKRIKRLILEIRCSKFPPPARQFHCSLFFHLFHPQLLHRNFLGLGDNFAVNNMISDLIQDRYATRNTGLQ
jgi:hypothetical protein